jgi:hypothetical protein
MTRSRATLVAFLLFFWCACSVEGADSGSAEESPAETCSRVAEVVCQKLFECYGAEERAAAMLPASEEACVGQIEGDLECASQTVGNQCDAGETYDADRAQDCVSEYEELTCDVVKAGIQDSDTPSCAEVCQ